MKLNKREEFMLWKLMEFSLFRYLLSFSRGNWAERAERHIEFSKLLWEVKNCKTATAENHAGYMEIHDLIANKITDHLPKTIGLDLDLKEEHNYNYDLLADKLFRAILKII